MSKSGLAAAFHGFSLVDALGQPFSTESLRGKVTLVVNVASDDNFAAAQYPELQAIHEKFAGQLEILAFPCNSFGKKEPGSEQEIVRFVTSHYNAKFRIMRKVEVNGPNAEPLYVNLKAQKKPMMSSGDLKWNFEKFLVGKDGKVIERYGTSTPPKMLDSVIQKAIAAK
ncbi:glutathione peroxidase [Hyaloraphidium curvatum]|nr:glutathione peroxidase [Hyaloraphidium curvatum]